MFQKLINITIYLLVFLLPLFWLPFSVEQFEFNKNYLLFFLVSAGLLFWLAKMIFKEKRVYSKRTPMDLFILVFLLAISLNVVFSVDKIASIFGFYGRFWPNLIGILCLAGFYFLVSNNIEDKSQRTEESEIKAQQKMGKEDLKIAKDVNNTKCAMGIFRYSDISICQSLTISSLINVFLCSSVFVVLSTYFFLLKIWPGKFFNLASQSFEGLAMFLAIVFVFLITFLTFAEKKKRNIWLYFFLFAIFPLLALIDFWVSWFVLAFSLILFLSIAFWKRIFKKDIGRLNLVVIFFIIFLVLLFSNPLKDSFQKISQLKDLPKENILSQKIGWIVGLQGLLNENIIFGSGNGTFNYLFNRYKPESFLNTSFWQIRFNRAGNHFSELLGTTGALGIATYLILIGAFLLFSLVVFESRIKRAQSQTASVRDCWQEINFQFPLLMGFIACLLSQFVYYQTATLDFLFWFFLVLGVLSWSLPQKKNSFDFKDFPELELIFTTLFWLILIALAFFYFIMVKYYIADVYFKNNKFEQAVELNNLEPQYQTMLSQFYLREAFNEFNKNPNNNQLIMKRIDLAIKNGQQAVKITPNRVSGYETLGVIYTQIQGASSVALQWGVKSFENALRLEPKNPILLIELGKLKMQENKNDEAKNLFEKAVKLKGDYSEAVLQLALLEEKQDKKNEAIQRMEILVAQNPYFVEAQFQLGRLYYNQGEDDKAIVQFQNAIVLFPSHSNSLYSLGLIYEKKGEKEKALEMFEKVLELNPWNKNVLEKIQGLK
jgi:tetratricopeptide (TPR) repeat protein